MVEQDKTISPLYKEAQSRLRDQPPFLKKLFSFTYISTNSNPLPDPSYCSSPVLTMCEDNPADLLSPDQFSKSLTQIRSLSSLIFQVTLRSYLDDPVATHEDMRVVR